MTEEALEQGKRIQAELERITEAKRAIMTYMHERLEPEVKVAKGLKNCAVYESSIRKSTLRSDDPLFVAIASSLEGIREELQDLREELQDQLDKLDCNSKADLHTYEECHPIAKTSWWKKAFRWNKK